MCGQPRRGEHSVIGKAAGETTLFAVGDHDEILLNTTIVVHYNVARLQEALHQLAPETAIDVSTVDNSLVLNGTVFSAAEGDDVRRIAARFVPDASQLVNKMQVDSPNQVNLRVRVAEIKQAAGHEHGRHFHGCLRFLPSLEQRRQHRRGCEYQLPRFLYPSGAASHVLRHLPG